MSPKKKREYSDRSSSAEGKLSSVDYDGPEVVDEATGVEGQQRASSGES